MNLAELRMLLEQKKNEASELAAKNNVTADEINAKMEEIKTLKAKITVAEMEEERERIEAQNRIDQGFGTKPTNANGIDSIVNKVVNKEELTPDEEKQFQNLHVLAFAKAIAKKSLNTNEHKALSSNTDEDGGYLIPKDILTRINLLSREHVSLRSLVTVETVTTKEGTRVLEVDAASTPFTDITELTDLPDLTSPKWASLSYKIRDLGGLLPIPNNLLADETGGLVNYIANWFVQKAYATDNQMILFDDGAKGSQGIIGTAKDAGSIGTDHVFIVETLTEVLAYSKLKSILNKDFPRPIAVIAKIVTNQSGLDILDNMVDGNGRPYLTGDGTQEFPYKFKGRQVTVYDDDTLPNDVTDPLNPLAPFIVGDLKKGVVLYDRQQMSVASSKEAGFKNNSTIMRGIIRQDVRIWDKKAVKVIYSKLQ